MKNGKVYYVYAIKVDDVVRYIGKGSNDRMFEHVKQAKQLIKDGKKSDRPPSECVKNLARAIRRSAEVSVEKWVTGLTESQAHHHEHAHVWRISKHNPGQLWNRDGLAHYAPPKTPKLRARRGTGRQEGWVHFAQIMLKRTPKERKFFDRVRAEVGRPPIDYARFETILADEAERAKKRKAQASEEGLEPT